MKKVKEHYEKNTQQIVLDELRKKLDNLSAEQPTEKSSSKPLRIFSIDLSKGIKDSWFRKGNFTSAIGYMQMLIIADSSLAQRVDDMRDYLVSNKFIGSELTTQEDVEKIIELVSDVLNYFDK